MSGSMINKHGFKMVFKSKKVILSKSGMYVVKGYMSDWLFKLNVIIVINKVNNASTY